MGAFYVRVGNPPVDHLVTMSSTYGNGAFEFVCESREDGGAAHERHYSLPATLSPTDVEAWLDAPL